MKKVLQILINGGSAIIYTIIAVNFFSIETAFGMSITSYYAFTAFSAVIYLFVQGVQFNLADVSGIGDFALDMFLSAIPLVYLLYVLFTMEYNSSVTNIEIFNMQESLWYFVRNIMITTVLIDIVVFGWAGLKLLLYTDKNAHSGS